MKLDNVRKFSAAVDQWPAQNAHVMLVQMHCWEWFIQSLNLFLIHIKNWKCIVVT